MNLDNEETNGTIAYTYRFLFDERDDIEFKVVLDRETLNLMREVTNHHPPWTRLDYEKCPNCPLDPETQECCPVAVNLEEIIDFFKSSISYEEVDVVIDSGARNYMKHTSLQKGISSLMGIYMVTSGCPILGKLKPMVRYHLPFATLEETRYRVISMYLLAQYFLHKRGERPDWELRNLVRIYNDVRTVNKQFRKRLLHIEVEDASVNALAILDSFAEFVPFTITENMLDEIELLCNAYLE
jgi:hypothetical protein